MEKATGLGILGSCSMKHSDKRNSVVAHTGQGRLEGWEKERKVGNWKIVTALGEQKERGRKESGDEWTNVAMVSQQRSQTGCSGALKQ